MSVNLNPGLFGIVHSNRDFNKKSSWGKNQFNNAFPVALANYMFDKNIDLNYLVFENGKVKHNFLSTKDFYGISPKNTDIFYDFESNYDPFEELVTSRLPRVDLVVKKINSDNKLECISPIEIKLTTLPDNSTCNSTEDKYSTEIVVRPDTIVYLATSIAKSFYDSPKELAEYINPVCEKVNNWANQEEIITHLPNFILSLDKLFSDKSTLQSPLIFQPIWKTVGKSAQLAENCLDVFVWSDYAFTRLFIDSSRNNNSHITRQMRSVVWLIKMLLDFTVHGKINHRKTIDQLSYDTKNDKAFAVSGIVTHQYLNSENLTKPRITKESINEIILGNGISLLSPERRLDGVIQSSFS